MDADLLAELELDPDADIGVTTFIEPQELLDKEDPANDRFFRTLENQRAHINIQANKMHHRHAQVARLHAQGLMGKEIAEKMKYTQSTVSNILQKDAVKKLIDLIRRTNALVEGPNLSVRKNMLWRIAANNEHHEAAVSLAAIRELNKIDGSYLEKLQTQPQVTIVINQDQLPKTQLDHYDVN